MKFGKIRQLTHLVLYTIGFVYVCKAIWRVLNEDTPKEIYSHEVPNLKQMFPEKIGSSSKIKLDNDDQNIKQRSMLVNLENPVILVWTSSLPMEQKGIEFKAKEEYGSCRITMDRSTLKQSIAVVLFNYHKKLSPLDVPNPKTRTPKQFYVFWTTETPAKTFHFKNLLENPLFDSIFNMSMSLMRTADVQATFGSYRRALEYSKRHKLTTDNNSPLRKKTKLAIWLVSNCHRLPGATERLLYAKSLVKAGLRLDKYGKCFQKTYSESRITNMVKSYKFYLSFENSLHCPDYVTEKFWRNGIEAGLVPIVWGPTKADVLRVAPPNSFIHSEDFETPEDLVKYLNYLDRNNSAYMEYHKWRYTPLDNVPPDDQASGHKELLSKLCQKIIIERHPPKTIPSISKLLYNTGYADDKCLRPFSNLTEDAQKEILNF